MFYCPRYLCAETENMENKTLTYKETMAWIQVVWHVMVCHSVSASQHFKGITFLQNVGKQ